MRQGSREAERELLSVAYRQLHALAQRYMRGERSDHTLQATALLNEAYLLLLGQRDKDWQNRAHFFGVAAQVMRRILVDYARAHRAVKRGGGLGKLDLDRVPLLSPERSAELLALDEALWRLAEWDPRQSRIVELRFFAGLSEEETAEVLGITARTVRRDWTVAKAWLYGQLNR